MYENLKSLGIQEPTSVDSYTLRQEANHDILKIYFKKQKGEFFAKSVKFKYPRQRKTMLVDRAPTSTRMSPRSTPISSTWWMSSTT